MATYTSRITGLWATDSTWTGVGIPGAGDTAIIETHSVDDRTGGPVAILWINSGILKINDVTRTVTGDCWIKSDGRLTKGGTATLAVEGDLRIDAAKGLARLFPSITVTVAGRLRIVGRTLDVMTITASGIAQVFGGSLSNIDASGGNRIVAYGSKDLGGNSNIDFYMARGKRAMMMLNRRVYQTGLA